MYLQKNPQQNHKISSFMVTVALNCDGDYATRSIISCNWVLVNSSIENIILDLESIFAGSHQQGNCDINKDTCENVIYVPLFLPFNC